MEPLKTQLIPANRHESQVDGELDLSTADQLPHLHLDRALATDARAVCRLAGVTIIDRRRWQAVLDVAARRNGSGPVTLVDAQQVAWLLDIVGLSELRSIRDPRRRSAGRDR